MKSTVYYSVIGIMVLLMVILALLLRKSLRKTLYDYKNINYIAAILFIAASLLAVLLKKGGVGQGPVGMIWGLPRFFISYALLAFLVLAVLLAISNIALIRHEGFRVTNLLGIILGGLIVVGSFVILIIAGLGPVCYAIAVFFTMMICYFECILIGTGIMGYLSARQKPGYDKDFIIIPGCSISKSGGLLPLLKGRTNRAINYAWEQEIACDKPVKYVPSGGQGPDEVMSEGSAMEYYLLSHGAEFDEVFPEKKSRNTYENFKFSKEIIDQLDPDAKIAFATTNYHMLRCGLICRELGFDAEGIASSTKWYFWPNGFVREFIAILAMRKKGHLIMAVCAALLSILCILIR